MGQPNQLAKPFGIEYLEPIKIPDNYIAGAGINNGSHTVYSTGKTGDGGDDLDGSTNND